MYFYPMSERPPVNSADENLSLPPSASRHEPHRRESSSWLQNLANAITVLVAFAAIALSLWEGYENRRYNRLSVLPQLERVESTTRTGVTDSTFTMLYALENSGLGPAVLKNVLAYKDGDQIFDASETGTYFDFHDLLQELDRLPFNVSWYTYGYQAGELLPMGKEHPFISLEVPVIDTPGTSPPEMVRRDVFDRFSFVFCYCSVYDEHCNMTYLGTPPPAEKVCRF